LNIKLINFNCSTNISVEEFISIFKERITQINKESWLINKFCIYQYGTDFLIKTGNKAVQSAIKKLMEVNVVELINNNYTLTIPYLSPINTLSIEDKYPIDTLKDKDKDKEVVNDEYKVKNKNEEISKIINKNEKQFKYIKYDKLKGEYDFEYKTKLQREELTSTEVLEYDNELDLFVKEYQTINV
jgi:hypothetical protein